MDKRLQEFFEKYEKPPVDFIEEKIVHAHECKVDRTCQFYLGLGYRWVTKMYLHDGTVSIRFVREHGVWAEGASH